MTDTVSTGASAPEIALRDQYGQEVLLSSLRGGPVLVVFYPLAFSGVCSGELADLSEHHAEFKELDVTVLAVSVDSTFALRTWSDREDFPFALLSDFWPHGATARDYGVFDEQRGVARRGTFLIDGHGTVRWTVHTPAGEPRDVTEYLRQARELAG
ncbi:peroxiredoxin [Nocardiopsis terrae]|uniref:Peroxiredoxin n=1 Tax=Nocardiopsis terrae TaxID=372655 RepID=A0ABR9HEX8_9ACTN|nr:peroxiredoxin [Nocardiopsis terrae]MBE1457580.1 peroxiredoxin [Nocardiopsis terrae]GHC85364.1 peroxiredoxin [Nocardiopsis terrae]